MEGVIPGCDVTPATNSVGQLFALEYMFAQALIFVAFGVGLDPRQGKVFGAALSPILVGASLALGTLASALIKPGYSGVCKKHSLRIQIGDICLPVSQLSTLPDASGSWPRLAIFSTTGCIGWVLLQPRSSTASSTTSYLPTFARNR